MTQVPEGEAIDEAAFIVLEALHLPIDRLDPFLDAYRQS